MPVHKLILLPADPQAAIRDYNGLATGLQEIGLIGNASTCTLGTFYPVGDRFLQLVSFLGCSPMIELAPPADTALLDTAVAEASFCHATLSCMPAMQFRADPQTRPPRCPQCGQAEPDWETHIRQWRANPAQTQWTCKACDYHGELTGWDFRKNAGFGKVFVEIRGIYPSEAVPGDALLNTLRTVTGNPWHYMYIKE